MFASKEQLLLRLRELEIDATTHQHPAVFTVEEAQKHCSYLPGGHCKNLLLRDKKKRNWLIVTLSDTRIDLKHLARQLGAGNFNFASPERLMELLGVTPGSVTPFALINDPEQRVNVVLDEALFGFELLNYHPLVNNATTALTPDDLLKFIRECGHEPRVVKL